MSGTFEIKKAKDGEFYFHLKASNGQIILAREMYVAKSSAENGIESVKKNAANDAHYERKETRNGQHMFNLKAPNHQVIGTSETYTTTSARDGGIESVKTNAPGAAIHDLTT
ncbi:YegP family protein [Granulicella sp. S190]|uniref:YegP family protein n=1 Tax=Granulicella sp. S190 TaxID=1747226 RepID=UPI00131C6946|nr:YegP family protein [Granulicella sp. S190]